MLPELHLTTNQTNWLTVISFVIGVASLLCTGPIRGGMHWLLYHLGRPGRHFDRIWQHRTYRKIKQIVARPDFFAATMWKRAFFALMVVAAVVMFGSTLGGSLHEAKASLHYLAGMLLYIVGLEGALWTKTYMQPEASIRNLRSRLRQSQKKRKANSNANR